MAKKKIVWTLRARRDRLLILEYWTERNQSPAYSEKLLKLFHSSAEMLTNNPFIGRTTTKKDIRIKVIRDYLMFYRISKDSIYILFIWGGRRDWRKLKQYL